MAESLIHSFGRLRAWTESRLRRVSLQFSWPVGDTVSNLSDYLGIERPISAQIAGVSRDKIGHVALLVHPRLMAIGINEAMRKGWWNSDLTRSRSDIFESCEKDLLPIPKLVVVDCHRHPGCLPALYGGCGGGGCDRCDNSWPQASFVTHCTFRGMSSV